VFDEFDDLPSMDEEPSIINNQNLLLITSSPIWNKSKMSEIIRITNLEEEKKNTFQTPLPGPRIINSYKREVSTLSQLSNGLFMRILP